jgi:hypothetical protein
MKKYESVFSSDKGLNYNACLNWTHDAHDLYAMAYKEAGDRLVGYVLKNTIDLDVLVYPIVFLYRQYIELRLKEIIKEGRALIEDGHGYSKNHKIWDLWCTAKKICIKAFENEDYPPKFDYVEHVIKEFYQIDPESFAFRYPPQGMARKHSTG